MSHELTIQTPAPGCTLSITRPVHSGIIDDYSYSVSLYCRVAAAKNHTIVQLAYATTSALKIRKGSNGRPILWTTVNGQLHAAFEITDDDAEAVAAFAGITMPAEQVAA